MAKLYILTDYNCYDTYKIGITSRDIQIRVQELNQSPGAAVKLKFLSPEIELAQAKTLEKRLHKFFATSRTTHGENHTLKEWFHLPDEKLSSLFFILDWEFPEGKTKGKNLGLRPEPSDVI
jgi:Meiotically up-regulated gene 113